MSGGRVIKTCKTNASDGANDKRCSFALYNTGGQIIWSADEEADTARTLDFISVSDYFGNESFYQHNAFGEVTKSIRKMTNDGFGGDTLEINPFNPDGYLITENEYDSAGRITARENDRGGRTEYDYFVDITGKKGKLESETIIPATTGNSEQIQKYEYDYNSLGDQFKTTYTEGSYTLTVTQEFDIFGRVDKKYTDGTEPVTQEFTYNARNLLSKATEGDIEVERNYDSSGAVWKESTKVNGISKTVETWRETPQISKLKYPDGKILTITSAFDKLASMNYNGTTVASYTYQNDMLKTVTNSNGTTENYTWNKWRKLDQLTTQKGAATITDYTFDYTRAWHLETKTDNLANRAENFVYDSYYRLKSVDYGDNTSETYTLDGAHNIRQSTENNTQISWTVDGLNRLTAKNAETYQYDSRNNLISESNGRNYKYDDLNRLIEVRENGTITATYTYDPFNRRIEKSIPGAIHRYTYNDWNIVTEEIFYIQAYSKINYLDSGMDDHIMMDIDNSKYFFHTDERGNVVAITDNSGNVVSRYRYTVYGKIIEEAGNSATLNNNFYWGGSYFDDETGLYWMRNRYYHIDMKRFINSDPIGIWGDANNLGNGFAYVAGMVVEHSDPTGLEWYNDWGDFCKAASELIGKIVDWISNGFDLGGVNVKVTGGTASAPKPETEEQKAKKENEKEAKEKTAQNNKEKGKKPSDKDEALYKAATWIIPQIISANSEDTKESDRNAKNEKNGWSIMVYLSVSFYPSEPDIMDKYQQFIVSNYLKKALRKNSEKISSTYIEKGDVSGFVLIKRNPFYREKDPMKAIYMISKNDDGSPFFVTPFKKYIANPSDDRSTAQSMVDSGFTRGEIDPPSN